MQRHTRAFTLLEVMIVVGMAAMVMAISIPFVKKTMHRDAVYQAVHVVEDACRNARTMAILNNATTDLVIAPRERTFSVQPGHSSLTMPRIPFMMISFSAIASKSVSLAASWARWIAIGWQGTGNPCSASL